jgi:uncharacterized DUF497 family protein
MKFQWDERKSQSNLEKHGINFEAASKLWVGPNRVEIQAPYPLENRPALIGRVGKRLCFPFRALVRTPERDLSLRRGVVA